MGLATAASTSLSYTWLYIMTMELLSTINADYVVPFRVTVQSFVTRLGGETPVRWHVFGTALNSDTRRQIEAQGLGKPVKFAWYDFSEAATGSLPTRGRFVPHVYARILAPELLPPDIERFLYLDGDLMVVDQVDPLWNTDLGDAVLGAAPDMAVPRVSSRMGLRCYRELGFEGCEPYFNAGVYLVNTQAWKAGETGQRALEYVKRYRDEINLMDQDALNAVLRGQWKPLECRWNLIASLAGHSHYNPVDIDPGEYSRALAEPGIVHFAGYLKPWLYPCLAPRWAQDYVDTLLEVYPDHRLGDSLWTRVLSFYDRRLRRLFYPLETRIWSKRRGF